MSEPRLFDYIKVELITDKPKLNKDMMFIFKFMLYRLRKNRQCFCWNSACEYV